MSSQSRLSRRDVLKSGAFAVAGGLGASAMSNLSPNTPVEEQNRIILGEGSHRYECIHDWLTAPDGTSFGDTHAVVQDKSGHIYVAHTVGGDSAWKSAVCVYDADGNYVRRWGSEFAGGAHGLQLREEDGQEYLYHSDTRRRVVVKTDLAGTVVWERGKPEESGVYPEGKNYVPTNVAFLPDGDFVVGDGYGSSYIHLYSKDGEFKKTIIKPGSGEGEVNCPHGLMVDPRGRDPLLVVADRSNNRLQYFDLDGKHVKFVTDKMRRPCHFDFQNGLMLIPHLDSVVALLDENNQTIAWLGDGYPTDLRGKPKTDFIPGKFVHPHGATFLANGDILVAEWVPQGRVTLLKKVR